MSPEELRERFFMPSYERPVACEELIVPDFGIPNIPGRNTDELEVLSDLVFAYKAFTIRGNETEEEKNLTVEKICEHNGIDFVTFDMSTCTGGTDTKKLKRFIEETCIIDRQKEVILSVNGLQKYLFRVSEYIEANYEIGRQPHARGTFQRGLAEFFASSMNKYPLLRLCATIDDPEVVLPGSFYGCDVFTETAEINKPAKAARKALIYTLVAQHEWDEAYRGRPSIFDIETDQQYVRDIVKRTKAKTSDQIRESVRGALGNFSGAVEEAYEGEGDFPSMTMRALWLLVCKPKDEKIDFS